MDEFTQAIATAMSEAMRLGASALAHGIPIWVAFFACVIAFALGQVVMFVRILNSVPEDRRRG